MVHDGCKLGIAKVLKSGLHPGKTQNKVFWNGMAAAHRSLHFLLNHLTMKKGNEK